MKILKLVLLVLVFIFIFDGCNFSSLLGNKNKNPLPSGGLYPYNRGHQSGSKYNKWFHKDGNPLHDPETLIVPVPVYEIESISDIAQKLKGQPKSKHISLDLSPNVTIEFKIFAIKTNGEYIDVTDKSQLKSSDTSIFTTSGHDISIKKFTKEAQTAEAELRVLYDDGKNIGGLHITVTNFPVCGNGLGRGDGVDYKNKTNIIGPCLKIFKTDRDQYISGPPSIAVLMTRDYTIDNKNYNDINFISNTNDQYKKYFSADDSGKFALMKNVGVKHDFYNGDNVGSQCFHFCEDLGNGKFGFAQWRMIGSDHLGDFFTNANIVKDHGLPGATKYWSGAQTKHYLFITYNNKGERSDQWFSHNFYCVCETWSDAQL